MSAPRLVCLLPARNAAADLPGYFASVARFADAIIALDDGSTDATAEMLAAHPLVQTLLRNPRREDYRGWNDATNRNRLLVAAASSEPDWIISVDADERIDPADARALRDFLATDALPGIAYGFRCFPMYEDLVHFLPAPIWVYRLFAFAPGQRFPDRALHFAPIPTIIPRRAFVRTTLRIQHLGGLTRAHRVARYEKYREADPERTYWPDYTPLLNDPDGARVRIWQSRPASLPVLEPIASEIATSAVSDQPRSDTLTVIVPGEGPVTATLRALREIRERAGNLPIDVAVAAPAGAPVLAAVVRELPDVMVIGFDLAERDARKAAIQAVTSSYLLFLSPTMHLAPDALAAFLRAHQRGYALAAATVLDGSRRWQEAADFLLTFGDGGRQPGVIDGAPRCCSYARALLEGSIPAGLDGTTTNRLFVRRGYLAFREPAARVTYRDEEVTSRTVLARSFRRGVAEGRYLIATGSTRGGVLNRQLVRERVFAGVPRRIGHHGAQTDDRNVKLLTSAGELTELLGIGASLARPEPGKLAVLFGRPVGLLLVALVDRERGGCCAISLLHYDLVVGTVREAMLPPDLVVPTGDNDFRSLTAELGFDRPGITPPPRFALDDLFARRFGIAIDECVLIDHAIAQSARQGLTHLLRTQGANRQLLKCWIAVHRGEIVSSLDMVALLLLFRESRHIAPERLTIEAIFNHEGETFADFASRVRAVVAPPERARDRTPRDALKVVEWA